MFLSLLPGFAPILVYIVVEAAFGETAGLSAGIFLGIAEFLYILFKQKRVDAFTLVDTVLLAAMGAVSFALSDPVFFRLKPAISGAILALIMLIGSLGSHRLFLPYMENKMGTGTMGEAVSNQMIKMIAGFGFLTLAHAALTGAAALWWSKAAWNFIAGALFWILSLLYMLAWMTPALARAYHTQKKKTPANSDEMLPVVDDDGNVIGKETRERCHGGEKILHPVVRLWLTDGKGNFWMQKRSQTKLVQGGKWDCAVGGHISFGETVDLALQREAFEEIGLTNLTIGKGKYSVRYLFQFIWETALEKELVLTYFAELASDENLKADLTEVDEIRLWSVEKIRAEVLKGSEGILTELTRIEFLKFAVKTIG